MTPTRPSRECAQLLLAALQKLGPSARSQLYEHTGLTIPEMQRGLRSLISAEVVCNMPDQWQGCDTLTGHELPANSRMHRAECGPPPKASVSRVAAGQG